MKEMKHVGEGGARSSTIEYIKNPQPYPTRESNTQHFLQMTRNIQAKTEASSSEVLEKLTLPEFWSPEETNYESTSQISYFRIPSDSLWESPWTGEGQEDEGGVIYSSEVLKNSSQRIK